MSSTALIQDRMIDEDDHAGDMSVDPSLLSLRQHPAEFGVEFGSAGEVLGTERVRPPIPRRSVEDTQSEGGVVRFCYYCVRLVVGNCFCVCLSVCSIVCLFVCLFVCPSV